MPISSYRRVGYLRARLAESADSVPYAQIELQSSFIGRRENDIFRRGSQRASPLARACYPSGSRPSIGLSPAASLGSGE